MSSPNQIEAFITQGLELFSRGQLADALASWRAAVELEPGNARALEYIQYVEENRHVLEQGFEGATHAAPPAGGDSSAGQLEPHTSTPQPAKGSSSAQDDNQTQSFIVDQTATPRAAVTEPKERDGSTLVSLSAVDIDVEGLEFDNPTRGGAAAPGSGVNWAGEVEFHGEQVTPSSMMRNLKSGVIDMRGVDLSDDDAQGRPTRPMDGVDLRDLQGVGDSEALRIEESFAKGRPTATAFQSLDQLYALGDESEPALGSEDQTATAPLTQVDEGHGDFEQSVDSMLVSAQQLLEQETYEGTASLCQKVLRIEPGNQTAKQLLANAESLLLSDYERRIGDLDAIPRVRVSQEQIVWHKLDHRAGFLISRMDGMLTFNDILDICGMGRYEACKILYQLLEEDVVTAN